METPETLEKLSQLIAAQNRTTHAVRSLAVFIIGYIPWLLAGLALIIFGLANPYSGGGLVLFGSFVILVGSIVVIVQSVSELGKSRVPSVVRAVEVSVDATSTRAHAASEWQCSSCGSLNSKEFNSCTKCFSFRS